MEANRMRALFLLKYEGARLANRTFNDREISDFLSLGQQELIKQRFASFRNSKGIGYGGRPDIPQSTIVRGAELSGLLSATKQIEARQMIQGTENNGALLNYDRDFQNGLVVENDKFGVFVAIPNDVMYLLNESVDTTFIDSNNNVKTRRNVPVLEVDYGYYNNGIYDYYAQPYHSLVWVLDWGTVTPGAFSASTGLYTDTSKTYSSTSAGYNMIGYSANPDDTTTSITAGTALTIGNWYKVHTAPITYRGTTYAVGEYFQAITDATSFTTASTGAVRDATVKISTNRSRYLLQGKGQSIKNYYCHYLRKPKDISVDVLYPANQINCELADFLHEEIVDYAVKLASASIMPEQGKYQVNQLESKEDE